MADKLWKKAERRICAMLGGTRRGPTGRDTSDCVHDWLSIEIKNRKMPTYIRRWMSQAIVNREPAHLPIVVWHNPGTAYQGSLVILQLDDFLEWFGNGDNIVKEWEAMCPDPATLFAAMGVVPTAQAAVGGADEIPFSNDLYFIRGELVDEAPEM